MRARGLLLAALMAGVAALALDPGAPLRLALRAGWAGPLAPAFSDLLWSGYAHHLAGDWPTAEEALRRGGPRGSYNRGEALARLGRFHDARRAYEAVLERDPDDAAARHNLAIVAALEEGPTGEALPGDLAAGDGSNPEAGMSPFDKAVDSTGGLKPVVQQARSNLPMSRMATEQEQVRRLDNGAATPADRRWLSTFPDEPGRYLKAVIAAEQARRKRQGTGVDTPADPW